MPEDITDSMPLFRASTALEPPKSPLELAITKCNIHRACELNALWHSRFPKIDWTNVVRNKNYVCFVAEKDAIAYAAAIWSTPIAANRMKDGQSALELRRMAISQDAPFNTASRMISVMRKWIKRNMPDINLLVSYQDTDVHSGTIYKASGWVIGAEAKGMSWSKSRKRNKEQSLATKIRWQVEL